MEPTQTTDDDSMDASRTSAYVAVGLLADATGPDKYRGRDVAEAVDHLHAAREDAPAGTDTAERVAAALDTLEDVADQPLDERCFIVRDALAELAPVAAGITDRERDGAESRWGDDTKPAVPVLYSVPPAVADRAIERFEHRRAEDRAQEPGSHLRDFIYDEIEERPVVYVGDDTLAEYAAGRVDELVIEPATDADDDEEDDD